VEGPRDPGQPRPLAGIDLDLRPSCRAWRASPRLSDRGRPEARCGTTTQKDTLPAPFLLRGIVPDEPLDPNTLLVHQIVAAGDSRQWRVATVTRAAASGFRLDAPSTQMAAPFPV
jgi:hypothetical protein